MATTIDKKVVEMQFNNSQFEKNIATSTSSLDKLKSALNFSGLSNSFGSVNKSLESHNDTIGVVVKGYNLLATAMQSVVSTIASSVWSTFASTIQSLSVDQILSGWTKYESITKNVGTIMASTKSDWVDQGNQMDYVSSKLKQLNWYTDETSWNLSDMTDNISKFTSAGVDLDTAVTAMQGIGNWAGSAGAEVSQMSRAMYNLSQAMSMGGVYLRDWMSIENANMATKEFKETAIATGLALGTLEQNADGTITTLNGYEVTIENFRTTLNNEAGNWFNSDVLVATLNRYGDFSNELYALTKKTGLYTIELLDYAEQYETEQENLSNLATALGEESITKVKGYITDFKNGTLTLDELAAKYGVTAQSIAAAVNDCSNSYMDWAAISEETGINIAELQTGLETLTSDYYALGYASFKASQESRTFTQALDATKDAVSTQWSMIFQNILGNYQESKELWTAVVEDFYTLFVEPLIDVNHALEEWGNLGGRDTFITTLYDMFHQAIEVVDLIREGFGEIFEGINADWLMELTDAFKSFADSVKLVDFPWYSDYENIKNAAKNVARVLDVLWTNISTIASSIGKAWEQIFPGSNQLTKNIESVTGAIADFFEKFKMTDEQADKLTRTFAGLFAVIDILKELLIAIMEPVFDLVGGFSGFGDGVLDVTASLGDNLVAVRDWIKENDIFRLGVQTIVDFFQSIPGKLDQVCNDLFGIGLDQVWLNIKTAAQDAWEAISDFFVHIPEYAEQASQALFGMSLPELWESIKQAASDAWDKLKEVFSWVRENIGKIFTSEDTDGLEETGDKFQSFLDKISATFDKLKEAWEAIKPYLAEITEGFNSALDFELPSMKDVGSGLVSGGVFVVLLTIADAITTFINAIKNLDKDKDKIVNSISGMFNSISGAFKSLSQRISADTIKTIATAILELVAAIFILSLIKTDKMATSVVAISALMGELALIMKEFDSLSMDKGKFSQIKQVLGEMMVLIAEITAAIVLIAREDMGAAQSAAESIAVLLGEVAIMVAAFGSLKNIDEDQMTKAAGAAVLMGAVVIEIAAALSLVGNLPMEGITAGALALSGVLAVLVIAMMALGESQNNLAKGAAASILMGVALVEIAAALAIIGGINVETLAAGALALSGILAVLVIALMALSESEGGIIKGAAALTVASVGLLLIASALATVAQIVSSGYGYEALLLLAAGLLVVVGAAVVSEKISVGLYALGVAVALIGVGALAAGAGLLLFSQAMERLVAVGPAGVQLVIEAIAEFFTLLPTVATKVVDAIANVLDAILNARERIIAGVAGIIDIVLSALVKEVPKFLTLVQEIIVGVCDTIIAVLPSILELIRTLFENIVDLAYEQTPVLIDLLIYISGELIRSLVAITPMITQGAIDILLDTLHRLNDNIGEVTALATSIAIEISLGILNGFIDEIPAFIDTGCNLVLSILNGMSTAIDEHAEEFKEAIENLANSIINAFCLVLGINSPSTVFDGFGLNIIEGLVNGIVENASKAWESVTTLANDLIAKFKDKLEEFKTKGKEMITKVRDGIIEKREEIKEKIEEGIKNTILMIAQKVLEFKSKGEELINGLRQGIENKVQDIENKVRAMISSAWNVISGYYSQFKTVGENIMNGLKEGIVKAAVAVTNAAKKVADDAVKAVKTLLGIKSPSRVFAEIGMYSDEGFAQGLLNYSNSVGNAAEDVGDVAVDGMSKAISHITDMVENEMDTTPTIRPVLDLTDVINGAGTIDDMLASNRALSLASLSGGDINSSLSAKDTLYSMLADLKDTLSGAVEESQSVTNNNTFNITGNNPKEIAEEVSNILQRQVERRDAAWA